MLTAILAAANEDLHGLGLIALVALGTIAGLLVVEAGHRKGSTRFVLAAVGVCLGVLALGVGVAASPSSSDSPAPDAGTDSTSGSAAAGADEQPLRTTFRVTEPDVFHVAFADEIGLPAEESGWSELIDQGGVDVHGNGFKMTLANRSENPLTITDIHAEVVQAKPAPTGSLAYAFTQGDSALGEFAARFLSKQAGSSAPLYAVDGGMPGWHAEPPQKPFFEDNYISLEPGEIYEGTVTVEADIPALIQYRFVISGSTPDGAFAVRDAGGGQFSGLMDIDDRNPAYERYYVAGYLEHTQSSMCPSLEVRKWFKVREKSSLTGLCP